MRVQVESADAQRDLGRHRELFARQLTSRSELDAAQSAHDSAGAQRNAARAQLTAAEAKLRSSRAQWRSAEAQVDKARAQVSQAQAALDQARVDLDRTIIRSPIHGTVISRNVDIGQTVAASLQAPTLFTIAQDLTRMQVDTHVSEADIGHVAIGQTTTFSVDAFPNQTFQGTVREIRQAPIVVQSVVNYNTVIAVDNAERKLRPGMTATVAILIAQRQQALKIPKAALRFQPKLSEAERQDLDRYLRDRRGDASGAVPVVRSEAQSKRWQSAPNVWILTPEGFLRPVALRLGISDDQFTELIGDELQVGQELVIGLMDKGGPSGGASRRSSMPGPPRLRF
jgi:HlyD family secretion protein